MKGIKLAAAGLIFALAAALAGCGSSDKTVETEQAQAEGGSESAADYDFAGTYTGDKYIDAMGCNIRLRIRLYEDGSFDYYRYPMVVALQGAGAMSALTDAGTFEFTDTGFSLNGEVLGQYELEFMLDTEGIPYISGKIPTGGAPTSMQMIKNDTDDHKEAGVYSGKSETPDGEEIEYTLELGSGKYSLHAQTSGQSADLISEGAYSFENSKIEFAADTGISYCAKYDSERKVIEGTEIPVNGTDETVSAAVTLEIQK